MVSSVPSGKKRDTTLKEVMTNSFHVFSNSFFTSDTILKKLLTEPIKEITNE
jgi:hypothetical protein